MSRNKMKLFNCNVHTAPWNHIVAGGRLPLILNLHIVYGGWFIHKSLNDKTYKQVVKRLTFCNVVCRVIKKYGLKDPVTVVGGMIWTVNGASKHARQLVAVFQVLCSLYRLTCVGYAQNSLVFVSHSPLIHVVGRSFCLYTDSLFAQIGDSNDKCSSSLEVECWNEDETHAAQQSQSQI